MTTRLDTSRVRGTVKLSETASARDQSDLFIRNLAKEPAFETTHLHEYCFKSPTKLSHDVAALLGAVRLADRGFRRRLSKGWSRDLNVDLPVYELTRWRAAPVVNALQDSLRFLTGDSWTFTFRERKRQSNAQPQLHLIDAPDVPRAFIPFSHGLDSYAQSEIAKAAGPIDIVPVNINQARKTSWRSLGRRRGKKAGVIPVAAHVDEPVHSEPSFRTRAFIYDVMAAYGAAVSGAKRVLVPENGQGSLGGSLVLLGHEAPHRSCHPGFTTRLSHFLAALTETTVAFEHQALFLTKGEVLRKLVALRPDSQTWLAAHPSCSYDARHSSLDGRQVHCGLCGNCMLRRLSIFDAGIIDTTDYKFASLHAASIESALTAEDAANAIRAFQDVAFNSCRNMQRLADLHGASDSPRLWAEVAGLSHYLKSPMQDVKANVERLLSEHHRAWTSFLNHCGPDSWVASLARA